MAGTTSYDKFGLTNNQRLLLECIEPGVWFDPEDYTKLRLITARNSSCKQLAAKGILLKRPFDDLGYMSFQYCLTAAKSKELGIQHREIDNA